MALKPLHVGISVSDMEAALEWYKKNLDFELVKDDYVPPLGARICFIQSGDFQLELFKYDAPKPIPEDRLTPNSDLQTVGTKHVAFEVPDMKALKEKFLANGVRNRYNKTNTIQKRYGYDRFIAKDPPHRAKACAVYGR